MNASTWRRWTIDSTRHTYGLRYDIFHFRIRPSANIKNVRKKARKKSKFVTSSSKNHFPTTFGWPPKKKGGQSDFFEAGADFIKVTGFFPMYRYLFTMLSFIEMLLLTIHEHIHVCKLWYDERLLIVHSICRRWQWARSRNNRSSVNSRSIDSIDDSTSPLCDSTDMCSMLCSSAFLYWYSTNHTGPQHQLTKHWFIWWCIVFIIIHHLQHPPITVLQIGQTDNASWYTTFQQVPLHCMSLTLNFMTFYHYYEYNNLSSQRHHPHHYRLLESTTSHYLISPPSSPGNNINIYQIQPFLSTKFIKSAPITCK